MNLKEIAESLHPLERKILPLLHQETDFKKIVHTSGLTEVEVMRAIQWLSNKELLTQEIKETQHLTLGKNGELYLKEGLPERRFLKSLEKPLSLEELKHKATLSNEEANVCIGLLKRKGTISSSNEKELKFEITALGRKLLKEKFPEETVLEKIYKKENLNKEELKTFEDLKKRKDFVSIETEKQRTIILTELGKKLSQENLELTIIDSLTPELLRTHSWKEKKFRTFDIQAKIPKTPFGRSHPLQEAITSIRRIFLDMGFKEMQGPLVETAFWCMDAMWIPQDHAARDVQDTFFLPQEGKIPEALSKKVAATHEHGGKTGSKGYRYIWNENLAKQLLLRTHTTSTTFRYFGEKGIKPPAKYFYIGRIFRNEAIDATHLPEFHQSEGFIMDERLTLRDLMGYIKEFYTKMGISKIKFKPTYNPYTEPSMEAIGYNEELGKWIELINSGIFRPEALEPYGINVPVIAWGLGVERLAMMLHQQKDIRNMLGATGNLTWFRNATMVRRWSQ